ncbi:MAG: DNA-3-methyladenine glycosylase [Chitinophagaceae bacterium]|nr:DNA-3-methyladenine glycosylase [Chitinophagaceae bacterium]
MSILPYSFYRRPDVLQVAADLMGKLLVTRWNAVVTSGRIVECEAYAGTGDRASHAFGGRRTARNEPMYAAGGRSYVYLCYGIHHLFNVVTNEAEIPHAILIRALEPVEGVEEMLKRVGKPRPDASLTRGPGNLSKALGIVTAHSNLSLKSAELFIADDGFRLQPGQLAWSPRIGVDYAGEDALLPYRLYVKGNVYVSGRPR